MNAEQCCNTIGCNCAGTVLIESVGNMPIWIFPVIVIVMAIIITLLVRYWTSHNYITPANDEQLLDDKSMGEAQ